MKIQLATTLSVLLPALSLAQVPVDGNGNIIGSSDADVMPIVEDETPRLSHAELQDLVGPVALYPDDLLAIVLPASAYPLQIVAAARFLEALEDDPTLEPDPEWDDSVVALLNYPEVIELLNEDLDWTWRLGDAVVAQQAELIAAVESFRDRAYAAGNLRSDEYQTVANNEGVISIEPAAEDVIYVPYYEPARVVYYQPRPAYYYHPRPYPVYYYPYSSDRYFDRGFFWGVTTAFSVGWFTDSLHVHHHSYRSHPYYGRHYWNDSWYRRPSLTVYNNTYVYNSNVTVNFDTAGDRWRARRDLRTRTRHEGYVAAENRSPHRARPQDKQREPIRFRERIVSEDTRETARRRQAAESRSAGIETTYRRASQNTDRRADRKTDRRTDRKTDRSVDRSTEPARRYRDVTPVRPAVDAANTRERRQVEARSRVQTAKPREYRQTDSRSQVKTPKPREYRQSETRSRVQTPKPREYRQPETRSQVKAPKPREHRQTQTSRPQASRSSSERSAKRREKTRNREH